MDDHFFCVCNVWFECFPVRSMLKGNICCQTHSQPDSQTSFERLFFNNCMWFSAAYKIQAPAIIHRITRMPVIFRNNIHFFTFLLHDFMVSFQLKRKYWHRGNKCRLRHPLFFPLCHIYADHPAGSSSHFLFFRRKWPLGDQKAYKGQDRSCYCLKGDHFMEKRDRH